MAFERNDIVNKNRLMGELGEELMGFEHNDIVTVDVMNKAIEEGGGGGGGDYPEWHVTINSVAIPTYGLSFNSSVGEDENYNQYYKNFVESDGKLFYSYGLGLDNGLSNKDLAFVILDDTASANLNMNEPDGYTASVTGDVEFVNDEGWHFYITGDGTITITAA